MTMASENKISNAEMKRQNKIKIVKYIYNHGGASKQELATELGFSMPTVLQRVKELIRDNVIEEAGEYESTGGRKAKALCIVPDNRYAAGLDITQNHLSFVLVNLRGEMIYKKRIRCRFEAKDAYYREMAQYLETFLEKCQIDRSKLLGVGISIPGIVDEEKNIMTFSHVLHLEQFDLTQLGRYIPYRTTFRNDANCAAYAEIRDTKENTVYLSLSNSVGGAIYFDGNIYSGAHNRSGEFGHMILMPGGKSCYCGKKGCMDPYCNARVLSSRSGDDLEQFFVKMEQGNMEFMSIWREYLGYLAIAISNLRMAFDCDIIVGGYVGGFMEKYIGTLEEYLKKYQIFDKGDRYIRAAKFRHQAAAMGSGIRFVEEYFENLM